MAYGAVDRQTWNDEKFRSWDRDTRDVWLYLLTCPHGNRIGCFVLDPLYVASDVQIGVDRARECLRKLDEADRIVWDRSRRVVCIKRHLRYNPLANPNVVKAAVKDVEDLPDSPRALSALLEACRRWGEATTKNGEPFYNLIIDAVTERLDTSGEPSDKGSREPLENGSGNPDQDQDHEQDPDQEEVSPGRARPPRLDELEDWLGDHSTAATCFHDRFGDEKSTWAAAVYGHYGPNGTRLEVWDGVPEADRPTIMAATLWSYIGDADEYDNRLIRSYLERHVREYWETGDDDRGDLSAADEKIIELREQIDHVDLEAAG